MFRLQNRIRIGQLLYCTQLTIALLVFLFFLAGAVVSQYPATQDWIQSEAFQFLIKIGINVFFYLGLLLSIVIVSMLFDHSCKEGIGSKLSHIGLLIFMPSISAPFLFGSLLKKLQVLEAQ